MEVPSKSTPDMRVWAEKGTKCMPCGAASLGPMVWPRRPYFSFGQHNDGAAFGGLIGQRGKLGGFGQFLG